jgi:hypothetical protein
MRAQASQNSFRRQYDHPISTWPSNSIFLKGADVVAQLMRNARFVFPQIKFNFLQICPDSDFLLHCKDPPILYLIRSRTPTPSPQLVSPPHCYHLFHLLTPQDIELGSNKMLDSWRHHFRPYNKSSHSILNDGGGEVENSYHVFVLFITPHSKLTAVVSITPFPTP